jgi:hypothetical protein
MASDYALAPGSSKAVKGQQQRNASPRKLLGRALLAFAIGIGAEFGLLLALLPFVQGKELSPLLNIAVWLACIAAKAVVPILARRDGESWHSYLGSLSPATWLYAGGGILAMALGMRLFETRPFPSVAREFRAMLRLADGALLLALFMLLMQFLYYAAEGVLMVYIVVKGSEAMMAWRPACPAWLAGLSGGLLLGLTWGLPHILSKGSLYVGLVGLAQSLLYGLLYGKTRSGLPVWLAWMGVVTF